MLAFRTVTYCTENEETPVGSSDLAGALGVGGDFSHPLIEQAWTRVGTAARRHGKGLRIGGVKKQEDIVRTYALGSRMVMAGNDITALFRAMQSDLQALKASAAGFDHRSIR